MKKKTSNKKSGGMLQRYKAANTKGNIANTGLKTLVDGVIGVVLGAGIGAATGRASLPLGVLMIAGSHYLGEDTGVIRVAGGAAIAYGIGKATENKKIADDNAVNGFTLAGESTKAKTRMTQFKDELITAFYLNKVFKKKDTDRSQEIEDDQAVGAIDLSALDVFEINNRNEAIQYGSSEQDDYYSEISGGFDADNYTYAMYDDVDLSNI